MDLNIEENTLRGYAPRVCNEFHFSCKKYFLGVYFMRRMKKVNKNIILFVDPVARVLANGNRTIEKVTKRYLSQN